MIKNQYQLNKLLVEAAEYNDLSAVKRCLAEGASPRSNTHQAMLAAVRGGFMDVLKTLHEAGGNIHYANGCMLRDAAYDNQMEVMKYLISQGADFRILEDDALYCALKMGNLEMADHLLGLGSRLPDEKIAYVAKNAPSSYEYYQSYMAKQSLTSSLRRQAIHHQPMELGPL